MTSCCFWIQIFHFFWCSWTWISQYFFHVPEQHFSPVWPLYWFKFIISTLKCWKLSYLEPRQVGCLNNPLTALTRGPGLSHICCMFSYFIRNLGILRIVFFSLLSLGIKNTRLRSERWLFMVACFVFSKLQLLCCPDDKFPWKYFRLT